MKKLIIVGIIAILILTGVFFVKFKTGNVVETKDLEVKEFNVKAFRFGYTPDVITVNKGDKVKINIENTDTLHGIRIPELNAKGNEVIEFTADKTGEFTWYCTNMCGEGHKAMSGKLIVK